MPYTERDGGDWYCIAQDHRLAEGFRKRDDAQALNRWLAEGGPMPTGWKVKQINDLFADLDCGQGYDATIWVRPMRALGWATADLTPGMWVNDRLAAEVTRQAPSFMIA